MDRASRALVMADVELEDGSETSEEEGGSSSSRRRRESQERRTWSIVIVAVVAVVVVIVAVVAVVKERMHLTAIDDGGYPDAAGRPSRRSSAPF